MRNVENNSTETQNMFKEVKKWELCMITFLLTILM